MKKALALAALIVRASQASAPGSLSAAPKARRFAPHQEPRGIGNLVAQGDRVALVYDAGVKSAIGFVYVRNDLRRKFVRLPLAPERRAGVHVQRARSRAPDSWAQAPLLRSAA